MSEISPQGFSHTRPSLTLEIPDGWFFKESYTLLAPDGQANVIASTEPLDPGIDSFRYQQIQGALLETEFPDFRQDGNIEERRIPGIAEMGYLRDFSWVPLDGVRVHQIQIYAVSDNRGITITATTPEDNFDRVSDVLIDIMTSLTYSGPSSTAHAG